ncbi:DNA-3-methyladenine glycosylase I, partial [Kingella kingae]|nr:DNA-3-methyladenine glycosylase I [Kingella kingae]
AYAQFDVAQVAAFNNDDVARLLNDVGIIRNRLKVQAAIFNAQQITRLQQEFGSFKAWLDAHHPRSKDEWVKLFKRHFKFVGGEIVGEFLISLGYLDGAHSSDCPIYHRISSSCLPNR